MRLVESRFRTVVLLLIVSVVLTGCFVRLVPPVKFIPALGQKPDNSMESILERARKDAVRLLGTLKASGLCNSKEGLYGYLWS